MGGVFGGDEPIARLACAELIEEACPGIRLFAASSAGDVTYQDPKIRGSRYTHALLDAARFAPGDLSAHGVPFVSDVALARGTRAAFRRTWPHDAAPLMWGPSADTGLLPLFRSQVGQQVGTGAIVGIVPGPDLSVSIEVHADGRRGVPTHVAWSAADPWGQLVHAGHQGWTPPSACATTYRSLVVPPTAPFVVVRGAVPLRWLVELVDDVGRVLARREVTWQHAHGSARPSYFWA